MSYMRLLLYGKKIYLKLSKCYFSSDHIYLIELNLHKIINLTYTIFVILEKIQYFFRFNYMTKNYHTFFK